MHGRTTAVVAHHVGGTTAVRVALGHRASPLPPFHSPCSARLLAPKRVYHPMHILALLGKARGAPRRFFVFVLCIWVFLCALLCLSPLLFLVILLVLLFGILQNHTIGVCV